jgi:MFS family permease
MAGTAQARPSPGWVLAGLSLSALLPALGTSIAHVALPTLTEAFAASFQQVQWVVLAYLLAITTSSGADACCWRASSCSP